MRKAPLLLLLSMVPFLAGGCVVGSAVSATGKVAAAGVRATGHVVGETVEATGRVAAGAVGAGRGDRREGDADAKAKQAPAKGPQGRR